MDEVYLDGRPVKMNQIHIHGSLWFRLIGALIQISTKFAHNGLNGRRLVTSLMINGCLTNLRETFYRTLVPLTLLYGSECWAVKEVKNRGSLISHLNIALV